MKHAAAQRFDRGIAERLSCRDKRRVKIESHQNPMPDDRESPNKSLILSNALHGGFIQIFPSYRAVSPITLATLGNLMLASGLSSAQSIGSSHLPQSTFNPVVITGTRIDQSSFSLPMSIDVVESAVIRDGRPLINPRQCIGRRDRGPLPRTVPPAP
jgi:hypothetical protein